MNALTLSIDEDGCALLVIDVPGRPLNVFTPELLEELAVAVERIASDPVVTGAVLTSGKPSDFLAGADLIDLVQLYDSGITEAEGAKWVAARGQILRRMETCGKPFVAAINGLALGGGYELCLACHHRIAASDAGVVVGLPEVTVGLLPGAGGTQRLPRMIGVEAALPLLLQGRSVPAAEALEIGLVDELCPAAGLLERARAWIAAAPDVVRAWDRRGFHLPGGTGPLAEYAGRSFMAGAAWLRADTQGNDPAPLAILSAVYEGTQVDIGTGLRIESKYFGTLLASPVPRNLIRTLFIDRRRATRLERRPAGIPPSAFRRIGVAGAGMMGAGIAQVCAAAGLEVVLLDRTEELAACGRQQAQRQFARGVAQGRNTQSDADAALDRIVPTASPADLHGCDLVVEAVFENRAVKAQIMDAIETSTGPETILASNTSTLSITSLAAGSSRPEGFIGMHFFSPVERMPLVEIILGSATASATAARALDLVARLRKTPIVVNDSPGFFTSRIFCSYIDEAMAMLADGVAPALIENAAKMAGFAAPPLAVTDEVSLDLQLLVLEQAIAHELAPTFLRAQADGVIRTMNRLGRLGRKSGGGFYEYLADGRKRLWHGLPELFPIGNRQPGADEVRKRLLYIQAIETLRCLEEGVLFDPMDGDLGAILGLGYPRWTGGPLSLIETIGPQTFLEECRRLADDHGARYAPSDWMAAAAHRFSKGGGRIGMPREVHHA